MPKIVQKALTNLDSYEYHLKHLSILNQILPTQLSNKELEVLAAFMHHKGELVEEDRFNSLVRKDVMDRLNLSSGGLSNHLREMIKKGFLDKSEITKRIKIKPILFPNEGMQGYQIKITASNG